MSFIAILFALLIEQARPLSQDNWVHNGITAWVRWVMLNFDAGKQQHGRLTWWIAVGVPAVAAVVVHYVVAHFLGGIFALVWSVFVLYLTLGFRQFSHHFTGIRDALDAGDEDLARERLAQWCRLDASSLPRTEIVRNVIEHSVLSAHRHVFGVLAWYVVMAAVGLGPVGAIVYRLGEYLDRLVQQPQNMEPLAPSAAMTSQASKMWWAMDWLPTRMTALGFAFVGSFEEAVDGWRQYEQQAPHDNDGIVIAATAGALHVQLGAGGSVNAAGLAPQQSHLRAVVGLVWRTVVLWMLLVALISLPRLLS